MFGHLLDWYTILSIYTLPQQNFATCKIHFVIYVRYMLSPVRLSVACLSVTSCTLLSRLKFSVIFLLNLAPWPSIDFHEKLYGDRPRGTPPSGQLNTRGVAKHSILDLSKIYLGNGARYEAN